MNAPAAVEPDTAESLVKLLEEARTCEQHGSRVRVLLVEDYERLLSYLRRPSDEVISEHFGKLQVELPIRVAARVREMLAALPEGDRPAIDSILLGTYWRDNGWWFDGRPMFQLMDGADYGPEATWDQVFGEDSEDLRDLTGTLSDAFGPNLDSGTELHIDLETGMAMEVD